LFHWIRALQRQLGERVLSLSDFWLTNVPQKHIISVYEKVILSYLDLHSPEWEDQAEKIESFRLYLESTYIGRETRSTEGQETSPTTPLCPQSSGQNMRKL
jgi:hypothetical protein